MYITHNAMMLESLDDLPTLPTPPDNVKVNDVKLIKNV